MLQKTDAIRIEVATNGYIVTYTYFEAVTDDADFKQYHEDKIVFSRHADLVAWVSNHTERS